MGLFGVNLTELGNRFVKRLNYIIVTEYDKKFHQVPRFLEIYLNRLNNARTVNEKIIVIQEIINALPHYLRENVCTRAEAHYLKHNLVSLKNHFAKKFKEISA